MTPAMWMAQFEQQFRREGLVHKEVTVSNAGAGLANNLLRAGRTRDLDMSFGILVILGGLAVALLVVIAALLFRRTG